MNARSIVVFLVLGCAADASPAEHGYPRCDDACRDANFEADADENCLGDQSSSEVCSALCESDEDCEGGTCAQPGVCVLACVSDADCDAGMVCVSEPLVWLDAQMHALEICQWGLP